MGFGGSISEISSNSLRSSVADPAHIALDLGFGRRMLPGASPVEPNCTPACLPAYLPTYLPA